MLQRRERKMALTSRKSQQNNRWRRSPPQVSLAPPLDTPQSLATLPTELIHKVASFLPPLSIISFSQTGTQFREILSFETGNLCWYNAIPPAVLSLGEEFQQSEARLARPRIEALGGPYVASYDYKREIIGHFMAKKRCCLCLCLKDSKGRAVLAAAWNFPVCRDCSEQYSITLATLKGLSVPLHPLHSHFGLPSSHVFYRPSIDAILHSSIGRSLADFELEQRISKYRCHCLKLEKSKIEKKRVSVRNRIVAVAECLWEGLDPLAPRPNTASAASRVLDRSGSATGPDVFHGFRERYAPTVKLRTFLFPMCNLTTKPTDLSYFLHGREDAGVWLADPTMKLRKSKDFSSLTDTSIKSMAMTMLHDLIGLREGVKELYGSKVTSMVAAAIAYHLQRLDTELRMGLVMQMQTISPSAGDDMKRGIRKLRTKLGLGMDPPMFNAARLKPGSLSTQNSLGEDQTCSMLDEQYANKYFHKLAMQACNRCPYSTFIFYPVGIQGLLDHMRNDHPSTFWAGEFHCIG